MPVVSLIPKPTKTLDINHIVEMLPSSEQSSTFQTESLNFNSKSPKKTQVAVVKQATMSRQYLVDALIENVEVALGRRPVKQGPASIPVEQYVYRWRSG